MNLHDLPLAYRGLEIRKRIDAFGECFIELMPDGSSRIIENDRMHVVAPGKSDPPAGWSEYGPGIGATG